MQPYLRVEQGIDSWLSAFAISFNLNDNGEIFIYSPYGLEDAFNMNIKPNKIAISETNYIKMTNTALKLVGHLYP
ncbi:nucleotidyltransferase family protein [Psychromonas sp. RZ5]|uniref:nucleotidyltransferase family protein n=1 Tax=Psychromonas algicola TaxID=2555642 RepID=UPI001ABAF99A